MAALWGEFDPTLLSVADVELDTQKIAGVRTPVLRDVSFDEKAYDFFSSPAWYADGIDLLKRMARLGIEYEDAIRKIKRFMEDEENLSKSAQKIVKTRQQQAAEGSML